MSTPIKASDIMTTKVYTIQEEDSIQHAITMLNRHNIDHIIVANTSKLVGIISKNDLFKKLLKLSLQTTGSTYTKFQLSKNNVSHVMTKDPVVIAPSDDLKMATEILLMGIFHALPVVDEKHNIVGIITSKDIMEYYHDQQ